MRFAHRKPTKHDLTKVFEYSQGIYYYTEDDRIVVLNEEKAEPEKVPSDDPFIREIEELIVARKEAKKAKNFAEADRIRDYLASKGVTLIDTAQGTTYKID